MTQANYALRLQSWLKKEAERIAKEEGTTLNQFINVAVAEKISAIRTIDYIKDRAKKGDVRRAIELLERMGTDEPPQEGDEIPPSLSRRKARKRA
jgi:hypothetical protein